MKKLSITVAIICMCQVLKAQYNSSGGWTMQPSGTLRTSNIFINIIYDVTPIANPFPNNDIAWPYTAIEGVTNGAKLILNVDRETEINGPLEVGLQSELEIN